MRQIPSIEQLRQRPALQALEAQFGRSAVVDALRAAAADLRRASGCRRERAGRRRRGARSRGARPSRRADRPSLRPVINATGVILHTNLGRAPLAQVAVERVSALAGYTNLEYDLEQGQRGRRDVHAERLLCQLLGAEAAVVVNNNAAATLLALAALAAGREVIISRGELVEIGGGVPRARRDGAVRRRPARSRDDQPDAHRRLRRGDRRSHRGDPPRAPVELPHRRVHRASRPGRSGRAGAPLQRAADRGHRQRLDRRAAAALPPLGDEPAPRNSLAAGVDVVLFSGDKLLGGPQAGIIAGRASLIDAIRRHPLMRALRVDKMTYAALEATLQEYAAGRATETIPVARMLALDVAAIRRRAQALIDGLRGNVTGELLDGFSTIGGGSAPGSALATVLIALAHPGSSADQLERRLRAAAPPIIARIQDGARGARSTHRRAGRRRDARGDTRQRLKRPRVAGSRYIHGKPT